MVQRLLNWIRGEKRAGDLLVVRRNMSDEFYFFCKMFANQRGLTLTLDRRQSSDDRRLRQKAVPGIDRRHDDRRTGNDPFAKDDYFVLKN